MRHLSVWTPSLFVWISTVSCGEGKISGTRPDPSLFLRAGAVSDSIFSPLPDTLVATLVFPPTVRKSGYKVRFEPIAGPEGAIVFLRPRFSGIECSAGCAVIDTTNADGLAKVTVRNGPKVGSAMVRVSLPDLTLADSVTYTIQPGQPFRINCSPTDTALTVGKSYAIAAKVLDRGGNPLPSASVVFTSGTTKASVTPAGAVSTSAVGRVKITVTSANASDSTLLSIVPSAVVGTVTANGVALMTLDLTSVATVPFPSPGTPQEIRWSPDGSKLVFSASDGITERLFVVDMTTGQLRKLLASPPAELQAQREPSPTRDGAAIYFLGRSATGNNFFWKTNWAGDLLEKIPFVSGSDVHWPEVSLDGTRLVYAEGGILKFVNLVTGAKTVTGISGIIPRWSAADSLIGFVGVTGNAGVKTMRPDGSGVRQVSPPIDYSVGDWALGDTYYVVRRASATWEVISMKDGERILIRNTENLAAPAVRPGH